MNYNPEMHHRRSVRLKPNNYKGAGYYFITICINEKKCLFGKIENERMINYPAGQMIEKWIVELENKFPNILCLEYVVMPNHIHAIIQRKSMVGADLRVRPSYANNNADFRYCAEISKGGHAGPPLPQVVQ